MRAVLIVRLPTPAPPDPHRRREGERAEYHVGRRAEETAHHRVVVAEETPQEGQYARPDDDTQGGVGQELRHGHRMDARRDRDQRADPRHQLTEEDRALPVAVEPALRPVQFRARNGQPFAIPVGPAVQALPTEQPTEVVQR